MSVVMITAVSNVATGQARQLEAALPPIFTAAVQAIEPPEHAGAWSLQILSRGGLVERRTGDLVVRSDGSGTLITGDAQAVSIPPATLVSLDQRIRTIATRPWSVDSRLGICSDCPATVILLSVREPNGLISTYTAFWDATTKGRIPEDLRRIHDLALTIQQR
jgi:hypothetical protein